MEAAALAVFVAAYAFLAVPALPRLVRRRFPPSARLVRVTDAALGRPGIALIGGALMLVVGATTPAGAVAAVDVGTLALLVGMMLIVAGLEAANAFSVLAAWLTRTLPTPRTLLVGVMVASAVLSALVLNDAVVLLFTPVLVKATRALGLDPVPFLVAEAVAANVGSVATPVGNPQNAFIALAAGISFVDFALALAPVAAVALAIAVPLALWVFRDELRAAPVAPEPPPAPRVTNRRMLALTMIVGAALLAAFIGLGGLPLALWQKAFLAGLIVLALAWPVARVSPLRLLATVDWSVIALFVGLFVLVDGVRGGGILGADGGTPAWAAVGALPGLVAVAALLSNLVSNVPAAILLAPAVGATGDADLWLGLAAATTLAGNATILGAAANLIVAQTARAMGVDVDPWRFLRLGLPVTLVSLAAATLMLGGAP